MTTKYLCSITGFTINAKFGLVSYLPTELTGVNSAELFIIMSCFTSILFFYASDYTLVSISLVLFSVSRDLVGLGLSLTVLWSHLTSLYVVDQCRN